MKRPVLIVVVLCTLTCGMGAASTAILDYSEHAGFLNNSTAGWTFSPHSDLLVTALGCSTNSMARSGPLPTTGDGLGVGMPVGLWDSAGLLLSSTTVHQEPAAGSWIAGKFQFESISAVLLREGEIYRIGCSVPAGTLIFSPSGANIGPSETVTDPAIALVGEAYASGGFTFPLQGGADGVALIGPNFEFTIVPEPQSLALMAIGGIALAAWRSKRASDRPKRSTE